MTDIIDFFFDFSSGYSYMAVNRIDDIAAAHGMTVDWKPILLGAAFQVTGGRPPAPDSARGKYTYADVERCAREMDLPITWPATFPFNSIHAARIFYALADTEVADAKDFARAVFRGTFGEGGDGSSPEFLAGVLETLNHDPVVIRERATSDDIKDRLKAETGAFIETELFGTPTFRLNGEVFWGADRMDQLERWISRGGW